MPFMQWSASYSIGIALFDAEHRRLIDMANDLHDAVLEGKSERVIAEVFQALLHYTDYHFAREEKFFTDAGYPHDRQHHERHTALRQMVIDFDKETHALSSDIHAIRLAAFLKDWIDIHILKDDMEYGHYLTARGIR